MVKITDVCEEEFVLPGTRACAGCSMALVMRMALKALGKNTIMTIPASCSTVQTGMQGFMTTKVSVLNTPFMSAGAAAACFFIPRLAASPNADTEVMIPAMMICPGKETPIKGDRTSRAIPAQAIPTRMAIVVNIFREPLIRGTSLS